MSIISKHILREVGVEFLIAVDFCNNTQKVCTLSYVEKRTGRTYSNLCNIAKLFEEEKLIKKTISDGRSMNIKLTEKGKLVTNELKKIREELKWRKYQQF